MHDLTKQLVAAAGVSMPTRSVVMKSTGAFIFLFLCWEAGFFLIVGGAVLSTSE